jgi:hypothetical protein
MNGDFHRGGFENAIPVHGERTTLRPVEASDVDLLVGWHADPDVSRFWDDETFTRETMPRMRGTSRRSAAGGTPASSRCHAMSPTTSTRRRGSCSSSVRARDVVLVRIRLRSLRIRNRRLVDLVVAVIFARLFHILF